MIVPRAAARLALASVFMLAACGEDAGEAALPLPVESTISFEGASGTVEARVMVADTGEERARGLMAVEALPEDTGMVFVHEAEHEGDFWMKDTLLPLSVAVWGEDMVVAQIVDMEPCEADPCTVYDITEPWIGALEMEQGWFAEHGVEVGAAVDLEDASGAPAA